MLRPLSLNSLHREPHGIGLTLWIDTPQFVVTGIQFQSRFAVIREQSAVQEPANSLGAIRDRVDDDWSDLAEKNIPFGRARDSQRSRAWLGELKWTFDRPAWNI